MNKYSFFALTAACVLLFGCGKKTADIKAWDQETYSHISFTYPKEWVVAKESNRVTISSSAEAAEKFFDHDPHKQDGVQLTVSAERIDSVQDYVKYMDSFKADQEQAGYKIKSYTDVKLNGENAKLLEYSGAFDEQTKITTIRIATIKDSTLYYVQYAAFNDLVEGYKVAFDTLVNSVVLPKPRLRGQAAADPSIPSDEVEKYANDYFSLTYPSNYSPNVGKPGKDMQFTIQFKAYRSDCYINIDILAAKKLTLEKVVDQNAKKINVLSKGNANIGGDRSIYLADVPVKGVTRRIYFVVKNDKIYRVIVTYASSMESSFLPAFQKSLASLHIK